MTQIERVFSVYLVFSRVPSLEKYKEYLDIFCFHKKTVAKYLHFKILSKSFFYSLKNVFSLGKYLHIKKI